MHSVLARSATRLAALVALACCLLALPRAHDDVPVAAAADMRREALDVRLPVAAEHRYRMNARVRPLLFWIRREDVGSARITWRRAGSDAVGYEFLVGSDPRRAPRRINRWGYIVEEARGETANLLGFMKQSDEGSVEDAERQIAVEGTGGHAFRAIRARVNGRHTTSVVVRFQTADDLTYRDAHQLVERVRHSDAPERVLDLPPGARPGFLVAVAELVREATAAAAERRALRSPANARAYVYNARLYDVTLRSSKAVPDFTAGDRRFGAALRTEFEIVNRTTRNETSFTLVLGTTGALAGVPYQIVFRPRWWFEAELVLDEDAPL